MLRAKILFYATGLLALMKYLFTWRSIHLPLAALSQAQQHWSLHSSATKIFNALLGFHQQLSSRPSSKFINVQHLLRH